MKLNLKPLFSGDVSIIPFDYKLDLATAEGLEPIRFPQGIRVTGDVRAENGAARLSVSVETLYAADCDRCAGLAEQTLSWIFSERIVSELSDETSEGFLIAEDGIFSLSDYVRESVLLALPVKFLCRPDCKGLCLACGINQNEASCGCVKDVSDPRWEKLSALLDK